MEFYSAVNKKENFTHCDSMDGHGEYILKDFTYLFLERGREGEREGEKHQCMLAS